MGFTVHQPGQHRASPRSHGTRRADHARHPQILNPAQVVSAGDARGGLLHEIPAPIRRARMQPRHPSPGSLTSAGTALTSRQRASSLPDTQRRRRLVGGAIGQRQRDGDPPIDTHHAAIARPLQRRGNHREGDMPTPGRIQRDPVGLPLGQGSAAPQPHPADLRYRDPRPAPVDLLHAQGLRADDPETLMPSPFAPCRSPMATCPPVRHRLLLHGPRTRPQPLIRRPSLGQLSTLYHIVREWLAMMPVPELLHREVPYEPRLRAMLREQHFLLAGRIQAKPHNRRLTMSPDNSGFLPARNGAVSTRGSR